MRKLYVVVDEVSSYKDEPTSEVWTLSFYPDRCGWETDGGCPGYGLTKADAEEIAEAYNTMQEQKQEQSK